MFGCLQYFIPAKKSFIFKALLLMLLGKIGQNMLEKAIFYKTKIENNELRGLQVLLNKYFIPVLETIPIFSDESLTAINFPVQYFGGDHDVLLNTRKTAERLNKLIPNIEINVLKETGHVITNQFGPIYTFLKNA